MLQKRWFTQLFCLTVVILAAVVLFSHSSIAGDPPHNEASGIDCSGCHGQTLLDSQSPFYTDNNADLAYNSICLICHEANGVPVGYDTGNEYQSLTAPKVATHVLDGTAIKCTVCHHNHDQDQIYNGKNQKSQFLIATGTLDTGAATPLDYDSGNDRTTISYATLAAANPVAGNKWADLAYLAKKTGDGRGAMLVPNYSSRKRWPVYIIKSIDTNAKTITVKGKITSASNLGIFYGQSIRRSVNYEPVAGMPKSVKFYDQTGAKGFTNPYAPYNGICQVCHENQGATTGIKYWRNDGTGISHNTGSNCMECHLHLHTKGINKGGMNHNGSSDCSTCHDQHHNLDSLNASVGNCEYCHADPRPSMIYWDDLLPGDNGNNYGTFVPTQMACRECHVDFSGGNMTVTKFSRSDYSKYTVDYTKTTVHTIANSDLAALGRINNYGICLSCHNGTIATGVTVWHARPDKHDASWVYNSTNPANQFIIHYRRCTGNLVNPDAPVPEAWAQYLPGRSSGTIGSFNLFHVPGFGYSPRSFDIDPCTDFGVYRTSPLTFARIPILALPGNDNTSGSVPVFPSLCKMTPAGEECPPALPAPDVTQTFNFTGSAQTFDIPANAINIQITVEGAGGGGGRPSNQGLQTAGAAGSKIVLPYGNPGVTLTIYVGQGGSMGSVTTAGALGGWGYPSSGSSGGTGEDNGEDWAYGGAGGGGASSVYLGGKKLAVARGGNGGRSDDWLGFEYMVGGSGGAGGGPNYSISGTLYGSGGGAGGTTVPTNGENGQVIITYNLL